jgi:DNA invertase Pin-like site-specific DNA recombinase
VSTDKQTIENQVAALRQIAERRGWQVVEQYHDAGTAAPRAATAVLASIRCSRMRPGVSSTSSWLGQSTGLGGRLLTCSGRSRRLEASGVDLYLDQQSIDTTTPAGKPMFQVCGAFAEFESSLIRQRVHAGLKRAVAQGKQLGRPRIDAALEKRIQAQLRTGKGMLKVAAECGVGSGTVQRIMQEMKGPFADVAA